jgi:predicted HAD superfamily Cof-like phosphohydrolase
MSATRDMVREFHQAFEVVDGDRPEVPVCRYASGTKRPSLLAPMHFLRKALALLQEDARNDVRCLRLALVTEELVELTEACLDHDAVSALDALCDLQYVLDGTVLAFGMDGVADEAFRRVHASNMSKLGADGKPVRNEFGKVAKGPNYVPVKLGDLVQ